MDCPSTPTKGVCLQFDDFKNERKMNINSPIKKRLEERRKPESPSMKDVLKKQQEAEDRRQKQLENVKAKAAKSCTPKKTKPSSSATPFTPTKFPVCIQIDIKDPTKANIDSPVKKRLEKRAAGYESPKLTTSLDKVMERQKRAEERRMKHIEETAAKAAKSAEKAALFLNASVSTKEKDKENSSAAQ